MRKVYYTIMIEKPLHQLISRLKKQHQLTTTALLTQLISTGKIIDKTTPTPTPTKK